MALPTRDSILQHNYSFNGGPFGLVTAKESIDASMYQYSKTGGPLYIYYNALNFAFVRVAEVDVSNISRISRVDLSNIARIAQV